MTKESERSEGGSEGSPVMERSEGGWDGGTRGRRGEAGGRAERTSVMGVPFITVVLDGWRERDEGRVEVEAVVVVVVGRLQRRA